MSRPRMRDVLIVGGGPAGCMTAIALSRAGRDVLLAERSTGPHDKVCGEFLSPETLPFLRSIGIEPLSLGARTIHSVRLASHDVLAEVRLPAPALSLTRRALDEALLAQSRQAGAMVMRGGTVETLSRNQHIEAWQATLAMSGTSEHHSIHARDVFLATGKHDMRGWPRNTRGAQSGLVAMKMYFTLAPSQQAELDSHTELITYPGGYTGLQPVEGGVANLCALIQRDRLRALGGSWANLLEHMQQHSAHLARRLCGAVPQLARPFALSAIPYGYRTSATAEGFWRLGDQAAVIPSFCGEGMAIALHTAQRASEFYLTGAQPDAFHATMRRELARPITLATVLSRAMVAMPAVAHGLRAWPSLLRIIFSATRLPGTVENGPELSPARLLPSFRNDA